MWSTTITWRRKITTERASERAQQRCVRQPLHRNEQKKKQHNKTHNTYRVERDCVTRLLHTQLTAVAEKLNRFSCVVQHDNGNDGDGDDDYSVHMDVCVLVEYNSISIGGSKRYTIRPIYSHSVEQCDVKS